jgi:hypothetical protein
MVMPDVFDLFFWLLDFMEQFDEDMKERTRIALKAKRSNYSRYAQDAHSRGLERVECEVIAWGIFVETEKIRFNSELFRQITESKELSENFYRLEDFAVALTLQSLGIDNQDVNIEFLMADPQWEDMWGSFISGRKGEYSLMGNQTNRREEAIQWAAELCIQHKDRGGAAIAIHENGLPRQWDRTGLMGGPPYHPMPYHYAIFIKTGPFPKFR